jgi:oxygen-independent coproporphyrinogen-3 oxidase
VGDPLAGTPVPVDADLLGSYFVSAYPPFSQWTAGELPAYRSALAAPRAGRAAPFGLYVHVPFCVERCQYCYYMAVDGAPQDLVASYIDAVLAEAESYSRCSALADRRVGFAYFGGGTPSLLTADQIGALFAGLRQRTDWSEIGEISFECAPRTTTRKRLAALRAVGVNRLSMGVQQLDDQVLERNGRVHRVEDVERAWLHIRGTGFDTVNLDLMVGMQGETETSFFTSLERIIELAPDSVTLYQLEIPLNTPLSRDVREGQADELASWDTKHDRLAAAFERLECAGYSVRSGYTAVRDPGRHGFQYQDAQYSGADLIGLGVASFSYVDGVHQQNVATVPGYLEAHRSSWLPLGRAHRLSREEQLIREMILQLKLGTVDLTRLERKYGLLPERVFAKPLQQLEAEGWLRVVDRKVHLNRGGLVLVDELLPRFYPLRHQGVRYS